MALAKLTEAVASAVAWQLAICLRRGRACWRGPGWWCPESCRGLSMNDLFPPPVLDMLACEYRNWRFANQTGIVLK
jgi:hypothetical protein